MTKDEFKNELNKVKAKVKDKAEEVKINLSIKWQKTTQWVKDHPAQAVAVGTAAFQGAKYLGRGLERAVEQYHQDRRVWDPSAGVYYDLKHKMNGKQSVEYSTRISHGENRAVVLDDMNLLK